MYVYLIIGPGAQPPTVMTSGTNVNQVLSSFPANVSFVINDDLVALEEREMYRLLLVDVSPAVVLLNPTSLITILDNDGMLYTCTYMYTAVLKVVFVFWL